LRWQASCNAYTYRRFDQAEWTLKIEGKSHGGRTTIRLIGHFQLEHVGELKKQLQENGPRFVLDLKEVTLVDIDVVRFLVVCETGGTKIVNCSQYIREWMSRERQAGAT
jgi:hypothetical protein